MNPKDFDQDEIRRLARLLSLEPGHPDRVAFEADSRHRALLRACADFETPAATAVPAAQLAEAGRALAAGLDRHIQEDTVPASAPRTSRRRALPRRFALAASVLLMAGAAWMLRPTTPGTDAPAGIMRGESGALAQELSAHWQPDGSLVLHWPAVPAASGYVVHVHGRALEVLDTIPTRQDELPIDAVTLDALFARGASTWSVSSVVAGDEIPLPFTAVLPRRP